jgi:hypothetical protein
MTSKSRQTSVDPASFARPLNGPVCHCLAEFFREEFLKHHQCLEQQREYYSDTAITQAEDALSRAMGQIERLCQRDDACEVIGQLLRQIDAVTNLSAWTERQTLN